MCILMDLAATLHTLLTTEAEQAARDTGCVRRVRKLSGATFVQTLVLGWLHDPHASLDALADFAADLGADLSPQALDQRFTVAATRCLAEVLTAALHRVVAATPAAIPLLDRFQGGVYIFDTTIISLPATLAPFFPGCGGSAPGDGAAALKAHASLELTTGALDLDFGPGRQPDVSSALARGPLPEGALRLADRGFFDLEVLQDYTKQGVFWITRVPARLVVQEEQGSVRSLAAFLDGQQGNGIDTRVKVGRDGRLACRLVARRAPAAVAAKRRSQLYKQAKKKGRKVSAAQLTLCEWTVYLTNLRADQLRWEELWVLARARWQIELLFKLWKSHGGLEALRGGRAERVLCELYAKLIGQVVQQWLLVSCGGPCLAYSYPKAVRRVRRQIPLLAVLLGVVAEVVRVLQRLQQRLQKRCRVQKRGRRPTTYALLLDPDRVNDQEEQQQEEETELWAA
jgi:Transposase DDE domain